MALAVLCVSKLVRERCSVRARLLESERTTERSTEWLIDRRRRCAALEAGFTSVRELGGLGLNLRRGSEDGSLPLSPHIYACGYVLTITGGHGDFHDMDLEVQPSVAIRSFASERG